MSKFEQGKSRDIIDINSTELNIVVAKSKLPRQLKEKKERNNKDTGNTEDNKDNIFIDVLFMQ